MHDLTHDIELSEDDSLTHRSVWGPWAHRKGMNYVRYGMTVLAGSGTHVFVDPWEFLTSKQCVKSDKQQTFT